jgi:serine/threonine protein kinase
MTKRLSVVDGGDQGRVFPLPESGVVLIGSNRKHTNICLHDLYVARVHCQVEVAEGQVVVVDQDSPNGTLVNGEKVAKRELKLGDVMRIGNSYLRLEERDAPLPEDAEETAPTVLRSPAPPGKLPHLPADRLDELIGQTLGNFKIGAVLGQGHFGLVFRAHDMKRDQPVALKVLPPDFPADTEEMRRFVDAVKPVMFMQHPNLVLLRGIGKTGPYVWLARELIEGESLAAKLERVSTAPKIKWKPAFRLAVHLARALEFAHENRLIHADLTPANILLEGDQAAARMNDLGFWDALVGSRLQQKVLERKFLAELPYLSPEHIDPDLSVDSLSDQYSVGALVYALATGRPPFVGRSAEETMDQIRDSFSPRRPKEIQRNIPDEFQAIVLRMLSKRPEERYPTSAALLAELEKLAASHGEEL